MSTRSTELTQERLKELLDYDPATGLFTWKATGCLKRKPGTIAGGTRTKRRKGYRKIRIDCKEYRAGRLAFLYMEGRWPEPTVEHINRIRADDRWDNLKEAGYSEQVNNRNPLPNNQTEGVHYRGNGKWRARLAVGGHRRISLGSFDSKELAQEAREKALLELRSTNEIRSRPQILGRSIRADIPGRKDA